MDKIKHLEIKKLLKELDYIESDYEYRNEIISEADSDFIKKVNIFLEDYPDLKELYDKKITDKINSSIRSSVDIVIEDISDEIFEEEIIQEDISDEIFEEEIIQDIKSPKIKKLYREIVKLTHPDKVDNKSLNDIYIKSTKFYEENDKIGIYKISFQLGLENRIDYEDKVEIQNEVDNLKNKILFLTNTLSYNWYISNDINIKNKLLLSFIESRIGII